MGQTPDQKGKQKMIAPISASEVSKLSGIPNLLEFKEKLREKNFSCLFVWPSGRKCSQNSLDYDINHRILMRAAANIVTRDTDGLLTWGEFKVVLRTFFCTAHHNLWKNDGCQGYEEYFQQLWEGASTDSKIELMQLIRSSGRGINQVSTPKRPGAQHVASAPGKMPTTQEPARDALSPLPRFDDTPSRPRTAQANLSQRAGPSTYTPLAAPPTPDRVADQDSIWADDSLPARSSISARGLFGLDPKKELNKKNFKILDQALAKAWEENTRPISRGLFQNLKEDDRNDSKSKISPEQKIFDIDPDELRNIIYAPMRDNVRPSTPTSTSGSIAFTEHIEKKPTNPSELLPEAGTSEKNHNLQAPSWSHVCGKDQQPNGLQWEKKSDTSDPSKGFNFDSHPRVPVSKPKSLFDSSEFLGTAFDFSGRGLAMELESTPEPKNTPEPKSTPDQVCAPTPSTTLPRREKAPPENRPKDTSARNDCAYPVRGYSMLTSQINAILSKNVEERKGHIYVFTAPGFFEDFPPASDMGEKWVKIGITTDIENRQSNLMARCGFKELHCYYSSICPMRMDWLARIEAVCHMQLNDCRRYLRCAEKKEETGCKTVHREWFAVHPDIAKRIVKRWEKFLETKPYRERGALKASWNKRLSSAYFESMGPGKDLPTEELLDQRYRRWIAEGVAAETKQENIFVK